MRRLLILVSLVGMIASLMVLSGCGSDKCKACRGTGYYNAVNCPMCHGSGHSDFDYSDIPVY